ncbi:MAG: hypothetical protein V4481_01170 [Patescibacteria group bacterium]
MLTERGRAQMSTQAQTIQSLINGDTISLLCSTAPATLECAKIFEEAFGVSAVSHDLLWSGNGSPYRKLFNCKQATDIVLQCESRTVVVITHSEYTDKWLPALSKAILKKTTRQYLTILKGNGWRLDCELGGLTLLTTCC